MASAHYSTLGDLRPRRFSVDLAGRDHRLFGAWPHPLGGRRCELRCAEREVALDTVAGQSYDLTVHRCDREVPR